MAISREQLSRLIREEVYRGKPEPTRSAPAETEAVVGARIKAKLLLAAEQAVDDAKTGPERVSAGAFAIKVLELHGLAGEQTDADAEQPRFVVEFLGATEPTPAARQGTVTSLAVRAESEAAGRQADDVSAVDNNDEETKHRRSGRSA